MGSFSLGSSNTVSNETIINDGFYPDVSVATCQESYRLPLDYSIDVIKRQLVMSIAYTNRELNEWRALQTVATLTEVEPENKINNQHLLSYFYLSAVYSHTKSELIENFSTMQRDETSKNTLEDSPKVRKMLKRDFNQALSFFTQAGLEVELI